MFVISVEINVCQPHYEISEFYAKLSDALQLYSRGNESNPKFSLYASGLVTLVGGMEVCQILIHK